jgi:hypothetical protein
MPIAPRHMPQMMIAKVTTLAIALLLTSAAQVSAWNKPGHMLTAALAADIMTPKDVEKVAEILRKHPQYAELRGSARAAAKKASGPEYAKALFMYAARWPDDARDNPLYHHATWHYVNYPIVVGQGLTPPSSVQPTDNIIQAFERNWVEVRGGDQAKRAIAVAWLMHLTGDAHQPLHSAALFSQQFPHGDRGGNAFFVRAAKERAPIELHKVWDGLVLGVDRFEAVNDRALALRARPEYRRDALVELSGGVSPGASAVTRWLGESLELAKTVAYRNGTLKGVAESDRAAAPVVPAGYIRDAAKVAERRAVLAAYRLADVLTEAVR